MKNNKLIAEFMGYTHQSDSAFKDENGFWNDFEVFETWNWLMPVVEKIECTKTDDEDNSDSFFNVMIEVFECNINGRDICICKNGNTKLEATYRAVVEFINEYKKKA